MTLRWGHWQPRDDELDSEQLLDRLLDRFCPRPLMVQLPDGRVMLDDIYLDELSLDELTDGLFRAEQRQLLDDYPSAWVYTLIELLNEQIAIVTAADAREKAERARQLADPGKLQWGQEERLDIVRSPVSSTGPLPPIPRFRGPKGGRS